MKLIVSLVIGLAVLVGAFLMFSEPSSESSSQAEASTDKISISTVNQDLDNGAVLLDVRTPEEYVAGYIERAENFPLSNLQQSNYPAVDKDTKIYVYCRSGNRSAEATRLLNAAGFSDVIDLGGVPDVEAIGGVVVK